MAECTQFVDDETVHALFERVHVASLTDGCRLERVDSSRTTIEVGLFAADGRPLPAIRVTPAECAASDAPRTGAWAMEVPGETAAACPTAVTAAREQFAHPGALASLGPSTWGSDARYIAVDFALIGCLLAALVLRTLRRRREWDRHWVGVTLGAFTLAVAARLGVTPTLLTWYAEVLPATGPPTSPPRFGPGGALLQAALRATFPWNDSTLFVANAFIGALAVPLFLHVLRERAVPIRAAACVGVLFALDPLHVRASASPREHVLASTLTVLVLLAWTHGARSRRAVDSALVLLLVPAIVFTRVDAWPQLVAVPAWTLLRDRAEAQSRGEWTRASIYWAAWLATGAAAFFAIRIPSHHPGPRLAEQLSAMSSFVPQFFVLAAKWPHWVSPVTACLAALGAGGMAGGRPRLLAGVVVTLACAYVPLGRTLTHDGLMGAHYFLATLPVFAVVAGFGFETLLNTTTGRRVPLSAALLVTLALTFVLALPAYRYRYASQSEYAFLRRALSSLPSGCTVHVLPARDEAFDRDLDCCVDAIHSPLVPTYPNLHFVQSAEPLAEELALHENACIAWYEGAVCSLAPAGDVRSRNARSLAIEATRCAAMRDLPNWQTVAETPVPGNAPDDWFTGHNPVVRLQRLSPR